MRAYRALVLAALAGVLLAGCKTEIVGIEFLIPERPPLKVFHPGNLVLGIQDDLFIFEQEVALRAQDRIALDISPRSGQEAAFFGTQVTVSFYSTEPQDGDSQTAPISVRAATVPRLGNADQRSVRLVLHPAAGISDIPAGGIPLRAIRVDSEAITVLGFRLLDSWPASVEQRVSFPTGRVEVSEGISVRESAMLAADGSVVLDQEYRFSEAPSGAFPSISYNFQPEDARFFMEPGRIAVPPSFSVTLLSPNRRQRSSFEVQLQPGDSQVHFPAALFAWELGFLQVRAEEAGLQVEKVELNGDRSSQSTPIPADLASILSYPRSAWRDSRFELFSWSVHPEILVFDFADRSIQQRFFRRLAFFVEKKGFRGQLLRDAQLAGRHGWNAHNYRPQGLSDFFNKAAEDGFTLGDAELELLDIVLEYGILVREGRDGRLAPGIGGLISITRDPAESPASRLLLLNHEALHGIYYMNERLVEQTQTEWRSLGEETKAYLMRYFSYLQYDPEDSYLMENEFQSYMLQQPLEELRWVFGTRYRDRLASAYPGEAEFFRRTASAAAEELYDAAFRLQALLYREYGFRGGDLRAIRALP